VPEADLRAHPRFVALPPPCCVGSLGCWADVARFRQDSRQWGLLHDGRLTTSRAAGALGILEPHAATVLGVPRGLRGSHKAAHALGHLRERAAFELLDLEDAAACLCESAPSAQERKKWEAQWEVELDAARAKTWKPSWGRDSSWRATAWSHPYKAWCRRNPKHQRRRHCNDRNYGPVQMRWGSVHEATACLCALNYFHGEGVHVAECGMFPGESLLLDVANQSIPNDVQLMDQLDSLRKLMDIGVPIGASPDGLLHYPDGTVEVLEVKNHSPFRNDREGGTIVRDRDPPEELPPWYVPQVQLEMLCVGPHCQSAVFVRLTATRGASVMRVARDDAYISSMLRRFLAFALRFLQGGEDLRANFGDDDETTPAFLQHTLRVSASAESLGRIAHEEVQRRRPASVPLLL
jgi:hypothetical protein